VMEVLTQAVTHFSGQLSEANPEDKLRVAGLITRIRHHQSKAGKPMGYITIEDLQGTIELVVFPRTWEKVLDVIDYDKIIVVDGRLDNSGAEPKVLVDSIQTELTIIASAGGPPAPPAPPKQAPKPTNTQPRQAPATQPAPPAWEDEMPDWESMPPPPDSFPQEWEQSYSPPAESAAGNSQPQPPTPALLDAIQPDASLPIKAPVASSEPQPILPLPETPPAAAIPAAEPVRLPEPPYESEPLPAEHLLPFLVPPTTDLERGATVRMITVILRSTGDKSRDQLRIRRIHGIITSYPGNDRFAFHIFERGRGYLLEFPNYTTGVCQEMITRLSGLIEVDNIRVDGITFQ